MAGSKSNPLAYFSSARDFLAALPPRGSILALDVSRRRLGLAGTDVERRLVTPLRTVMRRRLASDLAEVETTVAGRGVVGWVVGWPLNMDGSTGPACDRVRSFATELCRHRPLPLLLWDERLTTSAAEDAVAEARFGSVAGRGPVDHVAAAILLEDALRAGGLLPSTLPGQPPAGRA
jgi:putative Holliday junction resolvase